MEFDIDIVSTKEEDIKFFTEHDTEIIAICMVLCPTIDGMSDDDKSKILIRVMKIVATRHNYGQFKNLCDTCMREFSICESDPMFGLRDTKDNVCFCNEYIEE